MYNFADLTTCDFPYGVSSWSPALHRMLQLNVVSSSGGGGWGGGGGGGVGAAQLFSPH